MVDQFDSAYKAWVRCNNLMHYWILSSVILDVEIQFKIDVEVSAKLWHNLENCGTIWKIVTRFWINDLEEVVENIVARFWIVIYTRFQFVARPRQIVAQFCLGQNTIKGFILDFFL